MASLSCSKAGIRRVIVKVNGKRRAIHLGRLEKRQAEVVRSYVTKLETAKQVGSATDVDTQQWLHRIVDELHEKLVRVGLVPKRERVTLGAFVANYITSRHDVKPASKEIWRQGERSLVDYFGADAQPHLIRNEQTE